MPVSKLLVMGGQARGHGCHTEQLPRLGAKQRQPRPLPVICIMPARRRVAASIVRRLARGGSSGIPGAGISGDLDEVTAMVVRNDPVMAMG